MQFEGRRRASQSPNLTPLIDVVFLLLVFFMLTSHFVREDNIKLDLPVAQSGKADDTRRLQLVIDAQGHILFGGQAVSVEALPGLLRRELGQRTEKVVRIRGDRAVALGVAVSVLDAARKAGADGVDIVTQER